MTGACDCCGEPTNRSEAVFCNDCFMVWYDSGIVMRAHLQAEVAARKDGGYFPFGKGSMPVAEIKAIAAQFEAQT